MLRPLVGFLVAASACAHAHSPSSPNGAGANARALAMSDAVLHEVFTRYVLLPTSLRAPGERFDTLPPSSLADVRAYQGREDALAKEATALDLATITDPNAKLALELARDHLERSRQLRVCHEELWTVSPAIPGWQVWAGIVAQVQPVGTDEARAGALARFGKLPRYVDDQIDALREGVKLGYSAAEPSVQAVLAQLAILEQMPVEQSPLFSPAARDTDPAFHDKFAALVRDQIAPALHRYRTFLAEEYLPHARKTPGVSALPGGEACYRGTLRYYTTLDLDPRQVQELGVARLAELETEMKEIAQRSFGTTDLPALLQKLRSDPQYTYRDKDDITQQSQAALARARAALPSTFGILPKADFVLEPIPAYQEKAASPYYLGAALDGSRPAAYRVRYYEPTKQSRANGEAIAFHEVLPGHHLQTAIANERAGLPGMARYLIISGYNEGWGLYSERLADELGLCGARVRLVEQRGLRWYAMSATVRRGFCGECGSRSPTMASSAATNSRPDVSQGPVTNRNAMPAPMTRPPSPRYTVWKYRPTPE
jgi:uncharacterized protein (DUF885 family)